MSFEVRSGGVSGSGRFSGCFATDSAVHKAQKGQTLPYMQHSSLPNSSTHPL